MMFYRPSDAYYGGFTTQRADTGAATDADALPAVTATKNGVDDAAFVLTAAKIDTGRYKITGTVPAGYAVGDRVRISVAATVNSVAGKGEVDAFQVVAASSGIPILHTDSKVLLGGTTHTAAVVPTVTDLSTKTGFALVADYDPAKTAAAPGAAMTLTGAYDAAKTAAQAAVMTSTRGGYLDSLNVGGLVASKADVDSITQNQRIRLILSSVMIRSTSGSTTYRLWIYAYDAQYQAEDLDANPTITAENSAGTSRSANLGTVIKSGGTTGVYYVDYVVASAHALEQLVFKVAATEQTVTTNYAAASEVTITGDPTIEAKVDQIVDKLPTQPYLAGSASPGGSSVAGGTDLIKPEW